jgi:hypothetical protein
MKIGGVEKLEHGSIYGVCVFEILFLESKRRVARPIQEGRVSPFHGGVRWRVCSATDLPQPMEGIGSNFLIFSSPLPFVSAPMSNARRSTGGR